MIGDRSHWNVRTFVVNLPRSTDRRRHMERELEKTGIRYEWVPAIDGRTVDLADGSLVDQGALEDATFALGAGVPGAVGCALSHLRVYERVAAGGDDCALVLEDDVSLPNDLAQLTKAIAGHMKGSEVTLLHFGSDQRKWVLAEPALDVLEGRKLVTPAVAIRRTLHSTGAYLVTREAAERLAGVILPARVAADSWETFIQWGSLSRVRCIVPMPVQHLPAFRSTIEFYAADSLQGRMRAIGARLPVVSEALEARRRRRFERWGWTGEVTIGTGD